MVVGWGWHSRSIEPFLQVVAASSTLAAKPESGVAQKNMSVFKKTWMENVTLLTDAVNAITPLLDFTSVTGLDFLYNNIGNSYYIH